MAELPCAPALGVDYRRYLPGMLRFGRKRTRVVLPRPVLDRKISSRDDELHQLLVRHFRTQRPDGEPPGVAAQLFNLFLVSQGRPPMLAEAAEMLGLGARTLVRRLAGEGTSYSRVLDEFRSSYATALAREGALGAKQIAHAVGFRHHQSLRRSFRAWTGAPIGEWREQAARQAPDRLKS